MTAILLTPKAEWPLIAAERATLGQIVLGYILPLASLPVITASVKTRVIGFGIPVLGTTLRVGHGAALSIALWQYLVDLAGLGRFQCCDPCGVVRIGRCPRRSTR
jgi:hypothetical protein